MFSLKVIDTDEFLDMPQSSQYLYYNLAMRADDDGFIANPKRIMKMVGCNDDDIKVLTAKRFVIPFESGVCVIRHWRIHNLIRSDRYCETEHIEEKQKLLENKGKYELSENVIPNVIPNGNQMATQVRLGKVRLGKDNTTTSKEVGLTQTYGNENINYLMNLLKEVNGGIIDDTQKNNRRYCYLLLQKIKKIAEEKDSPPEKITDLVLRNGVEMIIKVAKETNFHCKNATSFKYLYNHASKIIQEYKNKDKGREIKTTGL